MITVLAVGDCCVMFVAASSLFIMFVFWLMVDVFCSKKMRWFQPSWYCFYVFSTCDVKIETSLHFFATLALFSSTCNIKVEQKMSTKMTCVGRSTYEMYVTLFSSTCNIKVEVPWSWKEAKGQQVFGTRTQFSKEQNLVEIVVMTFLDFSL